MRTSAPLSDTSKPARLPVNPRRSHVRDGERKRVKTACNSCNTRRIRCSGEQPCSQCASARRECIYPPVDKKISIAQSTLDDLRFSKDVLERCLREAIPDPVIRQNLLAQARQAETITGNMAPTKPEDEQPNISPVRSASTIALSPPYGAFIQPQYQYYNQAPRFAGSIDAAATEGSLLQDRDGTKRWLGGTSGASFLDHLKKFMNTLKSSLGYNDSTTESSPGFTFLASRGQYQTSDSRLLPTPNPESINTFTPPMTWSSAATLLSKVDNLLQDCMGTSPCGGIHYFGDLLPGSWAHMQTDPSGHREQAFYEAAFALGTVYSLTMANSRRDGHLGEAFFVKARSILGDCNDISRFTIRDVPTLALMAMYMTEMNRRDNAYMYLSCAMSICCMFGGLNRMDGDEREIRSVWTMFCLTRDVSCLMGRPPIYPDEAFLLPLPKVVPDLPSPEGLKAHIALSKIAGYIVTNTYQIAPPEGEDRFRDAISLVTEPLQRLDQWREKLPPELQIPLELPPEVQIPLDDTPMDEGLPMDRSLCVLYMKWNQLRILALRPFFFLAVKSSIGGDFINDPRDMLDHPGIEPHLILECSASARRNLRLGRHIYERCGISSDGLHGPGKLVMLDLHHIFNATVILLLHQMVFSNVVNTDTMGIRTAIRLFEKEARTECVSPGSAMSGGSGGGGGGGATGYASDCLSVLNDLAALVAHIRPLRFKGSEHVNTGVVNVNYGTPILTVFGGFGGVNNNNSNNNSSSNNNNNSSSSNSNNNNNNNNIINGGGGGGGDGNCSSIMPLSEEQLAVNLGLENPYGLESWYIHPQVAQEPVGHTNQKEMERWVHESRWGISGPLPKYTGM